MDSDVWTQRRVQNAAARFVPVKIDGIKNMQAMMKYRVIGTPILYVMKPDGEVVGHISGPLDPAYFVRMTDEILRLNRPSSATKKPTADDVLRLAYKFDLEGAAAALAMLRLDRSVSNAVVGHAAMIVGQANLLKAKFADSIAHFRTALDLAEEPMERSAILSGLASAFMMSRKRAEADWYFELVARNPKFPAIDRWCAEYQLGILRNR